MEGWGEETREKCKEFFWFLHTRVRERVRGALVCFTTQSERTERFRATTRSARAKSGVLLEMGSNFLKQTPQNVKLQSKALRLLHFVGPEKIRKSEPGTLWACKTGPTVLSRIKAKQIIMLSNWWHNLLW